MGFSQGDFKRFEKVELKENYIRETNFFTQKITHEDLLLKSLLK